MSIEKKKGAPQILKLDKASRLAEQWVNNMSKAADDESNESELESRPYRAGLGSKVSRQSKRGPSDDPIERKLQAKLDAGKRKIAQRIQESNPTARGTESEDDDEELESKSRAFSKKRAPLVSSFQTKKKHFY